MSLVNHTSQVTPAIFRGPRIETEDDMKLLSHAAIKKIINVESSLERIFGDPKAEYNWADKYQIEIIDIPCSVIIPPSFDHSWQVMNLCKAASEEGPIYIHCHKGVDRTGFMVALFRMLFQEWNFKDAVAEMYRMGYHRWYFYWLPYLKCYEEDLVEIYDEARAWGGR